MIEGKKVAVIKATSRCRRLHEHAKLFRVYGRPGITSVRGWWKAGECTPAPSFTRSEREQLWQASSNERGDAVGIVSTGMWATWTRRV